MTPVKTEGLVVSDIYAKFGKNSPLGNFLGSAIASVIGMTNPIPSATSVNCHVKITGKSQHTKAENSGSLLKSHQAPSNLKIKGQHTQSTMGNPSG